MIEIKHRESSEVLARVDQLQLTKYLTTAFLAANFGVWDGAAMAIQPTASDVLYSHVGDDFARASLGGEGFTSRWSLGRDERVVWIDRFDARAVGLPPDDVGPHTADAAVNDRGGANTCDSLAVCAEVWTYNPDHPDAPGAGYRLASSRRLVAGAEPGAYRTRLDEELHGAWRLQARVRTDEGGADFDVVLRGEHESQRITAGDAVGAQRLGDRFVQLDVVVELEEVEEVAFELRRGTLYVDDLRFVAP